MLSPEEIERRRRDMRRIVRVLAPVATFFFCFRCFSIFCCLSNKGPTMYLRHWHWTPNPYIPVGAGVLLTWVLTQAIVTVRDRIGR